VAQGHNKRTCRPISILTLLNGERQAAKEAVYILNQGRNQAKEAEPPTSKVKVEKKR